MSDSERRKVAGRAELLDEMEVINCTFLHLVHG